MTLISNIQKEKARRKEIEKFRKQVQVKHIKSDKQKIKFKKIQNINRRILIESKKEQIKI